VPTRGATRPLSGLSKGRWLGRVGEFPVDQLLHEGLGVGQRYLVSLGQVGRDADGVFVAAQPQAHVVTER
jgi:hypothetical protein